MMRAIVKMKARAIVIQKKKKKIARAIVKTKKESTNSLTQTRL